MNERQAAKPKIFPLVIILIANAYYAFPIGLTVFLCIEDFLSVKPKYAVEPFYFWSFIIFFLLLAGYIYTAISQKHTIVLWLTSMLYHVGWSIFHITFFFAFYVEGFQSFPDYLHKVLSSGDWMAPCWAIFMTASSAYYLRHVLSTRKINLP